MSRLRRASLGAEFGYIPGAQPPDHGGWLKLNTNEAPLDPSPSIAGAVREAVAGLRRYPSPDAEPLRSALAAWHGVDPAQVCVGNGADEVLDWCFRAWCEPGDAVLMPWPTYSLLPVLATMFGVHADRRPLDYWRLPRLDSSGPRVRFVVNPNAPTGVWIEPDDLEAHVGAFDGVTVIDEAYCDFAPASCVPLLALQPNWVVVRTFSKSYALAGLRVGYAIGSADLVSDLVAVRDSYPVDRLAIAAATAALADQAHHLAIIDTVREQRARLVSALAGRGWRMLPSEANFVLAEPPVPLHAAAVAATLRDSHRILVRHFDSEGLREWLRITVGGAEATGRLIAALPGA